MTEVDREQVRRVARLARLELTDEEVERLAGEMGRVLSRFSELEALEGEEEVRDDAGERASGGPPSGGSGGGSLRPDRPDADPLLRRPAEMAPEWEDGFFVVPRLAALADGEDRAPEADGKGGR